MVALTVARDAESISEEKTPSLIILDGGKELIKPFINIKINEDLVAEHENIENKILKYKIAREKRFNDDFDIIINVKQKNTFVNLMQRCGCTISLRIIGHVDFNLLSKDLVSLTSKKTFEVTAYWQNTTGSKNIIKHAQTNKFDIFLNDNGLKPFDF